MTPKWSKEYETLIDCINVTNEHAACDDPEKHLRDAIEAALRERDAAWVKAVVAFGGEETEGLADLWCGACRSDKKMLDCDCPEGAPLRALLEEAGK